MEGLQKTAADMFFLCKVFNRSKRPVSISLGLGGSKAELVFFAHSAECLALHSRFPMFAPGAAEQGLEPGEAGRMGSA